MAGSRYAQFNPGTLQFLNQLQQNNNRAWFNENKSRYEEQVLDPALRFIQSMQAPLEKIAPHFTAIPKRMGGSLMRVYRDTRFARNKDPYKTNIGIQFRHELARDVHAPGFYLHFDPAEVFLGVGMWHPDAQGLAAVRARLLAKPAQLERALAQPQFKAWFRLGGESLKRAPAGVAPDHPLIEHLKRKDHIALAQLTHAQLGSPRLLDLLEARFAATKPYVKFLCDALDLPC
jgi:uncharacterized protein (TIGR02453 family)